MDQESIKVSGSDFDWLIYESPPEKDYKKTSLRNPLLLIS